MKISIAVSVLILAIGVTLGWQNQQQLVASRVTHEKLVAEASEQGISLDPNHSANSPRSTKRPREDKEASVKQTAAAVIAFAKELEAQKDKGGPPDEARQKRILELMDRMMSLDTAQLKIVMAEIRASTELKDEMRQGLIGFSIMTLADKHPQASLALLSESADLFKDDGMKKNLITSSLSRWAKDDPLGAVDWVRKNSEKFPDLLTDDAKNGLIGGAAAQNPKLAFQLIGELGIKDASRAISRIASAAKTSTERTTTLGALRDYLANIQDDTARKKALGGAIRSLGDSASSEGFETASQWVASAKLTPEELASFANGLLNNGDPARSGDAGQWIEWLGANLPADKADNKIQEMVRDWTQKDYQAAGQWLTSAPNGPAKNSAICSYAEAIASYEPEVASQWAMTLPPGKDRDSTLREIYENWPKEDPAAKEAADAFAKLHGIK